MRFRRLTLLRGGGTKTCFDVQYIALRLGYDCPLVILIARGLHTEVTDHKSCKIALEMANLFL